MKIVPASAEDVTSIVPPCAVTTSRAMYRPRPMLPGRLPLRGRRAPSRGRAGRRSSAARRPGSAARRCGRASTTSARRRRVTDRSIGRVVARRAGRRCRAGWRPPGGGGRRPTRRSGRRGCRSAACRPGWAARISSTTSRQSGAQVHRGGRDGHRRRPGRVRVKSSRSPIIRAMTAALGGDLRRPCRRHSASRSAVSGSICGATSRSS